MNKKEKMKNYMFILVPVFLFLYSCTNKDRETRKLTDRQNKEYPEVLSQYQEFLDISYFPDISSEFSYTFIEDKEEKYDSFIPLEIIVFERFYEDTVTYKSKKAGLNLNVRPINAVDTSVMHVIYCRGGEVEQNENLKKIIDQNFTAEFPYPIPFIEDITVNASAVNALDSTYMVYVYQAEGKRAVPEKYHMNPAVGILPGEWPHGYSTGVTVSDSRNEIIYWAVAW